MTDLIETTFHWLREKLTGGFPEAGIDLWVSNVTEFPRIRNRSVTCGVQIPALLRDSNAAAAMREIQRHR
jgi:hypothetical protein